MISDCTQIVLYHRRNVCVMKTQSNLDELKLDKGDCHPQTAGTFQMAYSETVKNTVLFGIIFNSQTLQTYWRQIYGHFMLNFFAEKVVYVLGCQNMKLSHKIKFPQ